MSARAAAVALFAIAAACLLPAGSAAAATSGSFDDPIGDSVLLDYSDRAQRLAL